GHTATHSALEQASEPVVEPPPLSNSVSSVSSVVKNQEPDPSANIVQPGRSMTGPEWLTKASDVNAVHQHILNEICKGDVEYLQFLFETGTKIVIHSQALLQLVEN